jgi:hypothetical protein
VQAAVLDEARALLEDAQARCRRLLGERRAQLDGLAASLLDHEVLSGEPLARWLVGAWPVIGHTGMKSPDLMSQAQITQVSLPVLTAAGSLPAG